MGGLLFLREDGMIRLFCLLVFLLTIVGCVGDCGARGKDVKWSVLTADSFIAKFPDPDSIHWVGQTNHFSWQAGYVMFAMEKMWRATGDVRYYLLSEARWFALRTLVPGS
jgi:hypothetical protein